MLPAEQGDCLWIEYGSDKNPSRILIDGGTAATFDTLKARITALPATQRQFELFIITHIDADHIEGAIKLLASAKSLGVEFGDVWFNGYEHLASEDKLLGGVQAEYLSALLKQEKYIWNRAFDSQAVVIPHEGSLPHQELPGGMMLTLLSPTRERLQKLRNPWTRELQKAGLDRDSLDQVLAHLAANRRLGVDYQLLGEKVINLEKLANAPFVSDPSEANGSSIAVLAEFEGKSCLLTGDAFANVLASSIRRLLENRASHRLMVDAFKIPHHGSKVNLNNDLIGMLVCRRYLFSTNGSFFRHPDLETVARVIVNGGDDPILCFNYHTKHNAMWDDAKLMRGQYRYQACYPEANRPSLSIEL